MTPYHIAKLVEWAGTLHTRKRLQKVIYLLQAAGCQTLDARFILHHYGPYSPEVASLADQMTAAGLLKEQAEPNQVGMAYHYTLTEHAKQLVKQMESERHGQDLTNQIKPFEQKARELLAIELSTLEYSSTLVYFYHQTRNWEQAQTKTCSFKKLQADGEPIRRAVEFANKILAI